MFVMRNEWPTRGYRVYNRGKGKGYVQKQNGEKRLQLVRSVIANVPLTRRQISEKTGILMISVRNIILRMISRQMLDIDKSNRKTGYKYKIKEQIRDKE